MPSLPRDKADRIEGGRREPMRTSYTEVGKLHGIEKRMEQRRHERELMRQREEELEH